MKLELKNCSFYDTWMNWVAENVHVGDFVTFTGSRSNRHYYRKILEKRITPRKVYTTTGYHLDISCDPYTDRLWNGHNFVHVMQDSPTVVFMSQNIDKRTGKEAFIVAENNGENIDTIMIDGEWYKVKDLIKKGFKR